MRFVKSILGGTLACAAIAIGCSVSTGEDVSSMGQQLPLDPNDPPPKCMPVCQGKACGADDGCGHPCTKGTCPSGTVCGGGGVAGVCACQPSCGGKDCGAPDGCGGQCNAGACPTGRGCSILSPGVCANIPLGQGVECFVFDDGYSAMEGPSDAIFFAADGKACVPDGTSTGRCRKWWGRCRTSDASHTPVTFRGGDVDIFTGKLSWSGSTDAFFSHHFTPFLQPTDSEACLPNGTTAGECHTYFGNAATQTGNPVRCHLFSDGYASMTGLTDRMHEIPGSGVWGAGVNGATRKWFGACQVGGCGDGFCDPSESAQTCNTDCHCGNGACDEGETASSCAVDCAKCGDGVCNGGETAKSCAADCTKCGDGVCTGAETCSSCSKDCGTCPVTCSGEAPSSSATLFVLGFEDGNSCAGFVTEFANSREEAEKCVVLQGGTVASGTTIDREFHIDSNNGCAWQTFTGFSEESVAKCAASKGFTLEGPCK